MKPFNVLDHTIQFNIGLIVFLALILAGCGGGGGGGGGTLPPSHEGPNAGIGSVRIIFPSDTGAYQTDRITVRLSGASFTPAGSSCPSGVGVLPQNYVVTWLNSSNGSSFPAQASLNCLVFITTGWDTGNIIPLALGANSIIVTADDGAGNVGRDTIVVTRVPDTTPPTVISVLPANGATGVGINTGVTVTFSEAMDPSTINSTTITLIDGSGNPVPAAVTYDGLSLSASLTPSILLAHNTTYLATITTAVRDAPGGNALAAPYIFTFTTSL